ncbi:MAG: ABC transporter ATP-binding protein [Firmicutes bacterium]|nr:ABC transporter ATP-binding protein [Bacillota bacterium]
MGLVQDYGGKRHVLKGVDLSISCGELVAIVGENGAGKTTLVKHFNGLLRPSRGDVRIDGKSIKDTPVSQVARNVGYVFQNPDHQIFHDTVWGEISFGPRQLGLGEEEIERRVYQAMVAVGLVAHAQDYPMALSRGTRQRIAVASVMAMGCRLIVLDEPTTGQDYYEAQQIMQLANELRTHGTAIVFVTHDMELVAEHALRVVVMAKGEILLDGPPQRVFGETQVLERAHIMPPQITQLGHAWNRTTYLDSTSLVQAVAGTMDKGERVLAVG